MLSTKRRTNAILLSNRLKKFSKRISIRMLSMLMARILERENATTLRLMKF